MVSAHHVLRASLDPLDRTVETLASATTGLLGYTWSFEPKPPPTSGAITRSLSSGIPTLRENEPAICGTCVDVYRVTRRRAGRPARLASRSLRRRPVVDEALLDDNVSLPSAASMSPPEISTHAPCWSRTAPTRAANLLERPLGVGHDLLGLILDDHLLGGVDHRVAIAPHHHGDRVATCLTSPRLSGQASGLLTSTPGGLHTDAIPLLKSPARSSPVNTATTSGCAARPRYRWR